MNNDLYSLINCVSPVFHQAPDSNSGNISYQRKLPVLTKDETGKFVASDIPGISGNARRCVPSDKIIRLLARLLSATYFLGNRRAGLL